MGFSMFAHNFNQQRQADIEIIRNAVERIYRIE
jgi:hypothetical protein